jgi:hypothetical protein
MGDCILKGVYFEENPYRYIAGSVETEATPTPNIQPFLPSGVMVMGINSWLEKLLLTYKIKFYRR